MRIRTKIALVFTLMTAAMLLTLSGFIYFLSLHHTHDYFFSRLKGRVSIAAESQFDVNHANSSLVQGIRERHFEELPQQKEYFFQNGNNILREFTTQLPELPESFLAEIQNQGAAEYYIGFQHYSGIAYPAGEKRSIAIASAYDANGENQVTFLFNVLLLGFSVSCLLVFGIGRIFANRIMKPISAIISKVHGITASNLGERLGEGQGNDELAEMAGTFNNMLDRLETTFELQSNFISNASHELRTPLTSILGEAEVILQSPRKQDEYITSIQVMQHEAKRLDDVTTSLLKLSQISFDGKKQKIEPVYMDELLLSIKISLDKRMPDNQVNVMVQPAEDNPDSFILVCVRVWMELALTNIIQNSIKYSDNKEVLVTLAVSQKDFFIHISDYGIGIPPEDMQHIYEPFFRASNTSKYTGYGIGLPLASKIIRLHGGKINVQSRTNSGTKVSLQFKKNDIKTVLE